MQYPPKHIAVDWMNTIWETNLPSNAKLVAANLRRYMNAKNDMAWPSIARVAGECGLCQRSVQGALKILCSDGWLVQSGQSKLKTNVYQAAFPKSMPDPRITCTPQEMHPAGAAPHPRRRCTLTPAGDAPELNKVIKQVIKQGARFTPPSVSEVSEYCSSRGNSIDPQAFVDHYEANGWMRGKTKIKDWRACVRTWEANSPAKKESAAWR
jgi:hypothetical protein